MSVDGCTIRVNFLEKKNEKERRIISIDGAFRRRLVISEKNIHIGIPLSKGAKITALDWHALVKS
ncbi:hypothetical protein WN48_05666 [Eufriesea mexicana]|nr:hypothetical protein WN48_05666 [Eufriesea mexicana]